MSHRGFNFAAIVFVALVFPVGGYSKDPVTLHTAVRERQEGPSSLPEGDLSLIEEMIVNEWHGEIPSASFEAFQAQLKTSLKNQSRVAGVKIPDGRSLQRGHSTFDYPRAIFSASELDSLGSDSAKSFMGYAPEANQIEIISWNPKSGRYEFSIIDNFGPGLTPTLRRADRNTCLVCHQHGGPIFSRFPWAETSGNATPNSALREKLDQRLDRSHGPDEPLSAINAPKDSPAKRLADFSRRYRSIMNDNAFDFDDKVRKAAMRLQATQICHTICENDLECREAALKAILLGTTKLVASEPEDSKLRNELHNKYSALLTKRWPKDNFAYPSSVLLDRDPLARTEEGGRGTYFEVTDRTKLLNSLGLVSEPLNLAQRTARNFLFTPSELRQFEANRASNESGARLNRDLIENPQLIAFSERHSLDSLQREGIEFASVVGIEGRSLINPKTPRPLVGAVHKDAVIDAMVFSDRFSEACFELSEADMVPLVAKGARNLRKGIANADFRELVKQWPPDQQKLKDQLQEISLGKVHAEAVEGDEHRSQASTLHPSIILTKYCAQCHGKSESEKKLPLDDLEAMKSLYGEAVYHKIMNREMPPATAEHSLPSAEREALKQAFQDYAR